jgi:hypothetical protein
LLSLVYIVAAPAGAITGLGGSALMAVIPGPVHVSRGS